MLISKKNQLEKCLGKNSSDGQLWIRVNPDDYENVKDMDDRLHDELESSALKTFDYKIKQQFCEKSLRIMILTASSTKLKNFCLSSLSSNTQIELNEGYMKGVVKLCAATQEQVYLTDLILTSDQFKLIFEHSSKSKSLTMMRWKINDIPKNFQFDDTLEYKIQRFEPRKAVSLQGLVRFAKAVRKTSQLEKSLNCVLIHKIYEKHARKAFGKIGIDVEIDKWNQ